MTLHTFCISPATGFLLEVDNISLEHTPGILKTLNERSSLMNCWFGGLGYVLGLGLAYQNKLYFITYVKV